VKRPARLAFRTTKLLGRREAASPEKRASGATHDRPPYSECQHLALFESLIAIDQPARLKAESVLFVNVCSWLPKGDIAGLA